MVAGKIPRICALSSPYHISVGSCTTVSNSCPLALDVLPSQASSVPCERIFSGSKQIATDRQACLGPKVFEELVIMKSAWGPGLYDHAALHTSEVEEVDLVEFEELLIDDEDCIAWDQE